MKPDYVKYSIVPYTSGRGIELNPSLQTGKMYPHFIGSAEDDLFLIANGILDFFVVANEVKAIAIEDWWKKLKPGGHLVLAQPADCTGPMLQLCGWDCVVNENEGGGYLQVFKKRSDKNRTWIEAPSKSCAVVRYGAFGDMIQMSSILPELKKLGYHVTLFTSKVGAEIVTNDPNIDVIFAQDKEQVPNRELGAFWDVIKEKYDRFINLSESVEGTLLAIPGRPNHRWEKSVRHEMMNRNYSEFTHLLANVATRHPLDIRFYPTRNEKKWAEKQRRKIFGRTILWVMSGSSVHKTWPYLDQAIARILVEYQDAQIVTAGADFDSILEAGWHEEPRVHQKCGKWSIRDTLAFAMEADCVIGPETGVMNAVSMLDIPKILFLSHSSIENLSKHWKNCASLEPENCQCYPCHMLHYGFDFCSRDDKTGTAECQAKISVDAFWNAFTRAMENRKAA